MSQTTLLACLFLGLVLRVVAEPEAPLVVLPGYFTVSPGGDWSKPEGEDLGQGPVHMKFRHCTSVSRPEDMMVLGAIKIVDPEKIPDPTLRTMDAEKMVRFMIASLRPSKAGEKLAKSEPRIRRLENEGLARFFYTLTLGSGKETVVISGITMDAERGASAIQLSRPQSKDGDRYDSAFWKRLIKTITPVVEKPKR